MQIVDEDHDRPGARNLLQEYRQFSYQPLWRSSRYLLGQPGFQMSTGKTRGGVHVPRRREAAKCSCNARVVDKQLVNGFENRQVRLSASQTFRAPAFSYDAFLG